MRINILLLVITFFLFSCGEEEQPEDKSPKELTTYNVLSYLNAHPIIDTSKVTIPDNYYNLIAVKQQEKKYFDNWQRLHNHEDAEESFLSIWSQFGEVLDLITLEFKIIQSLGLNPRIVFFKKEEFYQKLNLPFQPFANATLFEVLQNQLLFAQNLIDNYDRKTIESRLNDFFNTYPDFTEAEEDALRFDLMRWYILENEGLIRNHKDASHN